jgi:23S rRNA pseudoU1915 N3-methylase RlmH
LQDLQKLLSENTRCWAYKTHIKNKTTLNFIKLLYEKEQNGEEAIWNLEGYAAGHNNEVQKVANFKLYLTK